MTQLNGKTKFRMPWKPGPTKSHRSRWPQKQKPAPANNRVESLIQQPPRGGFWKFPLCGKLMAVYQSLWPKWVIAHIIAYKYSLIIQLLLMTQTLSDFPALCPLMVPFSLMNMMSELKSSFLHSKNFNSNWVL